ncbi:MAG: hypothetical protein A2Y17_13035 [Clostridiales bacterium GWF2_38_85]|nr:MAG: hypothetical protein A2Y17_13035 [Clostridiales bacterium GWF2_38_85]HBL84181.1 hypothetical protein [Clostridiales bacterium]
MTCITNQLNKMNINYNALTEIRSKDSVSVYRVTCCDGISYVLKYFEKESDRREIKNYEILHTLGVQTLEIIAKTDCALLMEDIEQSKDYRLGIVEDMDDPSVMAALAKWYKHLHSKGKAYVSEHGERMYDETDCITLENIKIIAGKTNTVDNPVWALMEINFEAIKSKITQVQRTLTYNDFYYTNFIIAKDKSTAFMFDYNLLGKGYVYADIRNVTYSLGDAAKTVFLEEYGSFDESEKLIDDVASAITTLFFACNKEIMPNWALKYIEQIRSGKLLKAVERMLHNEPYNKTANT